MLARCSGMRASLAADLAVHAHWASATSGVKEMAQITFRLEPQIWIRNWQQRSECGYACTRSASRTLPGILSRPCAAPNA